MDMLSPAEQEKLIKELSEPFAYLTGNIPETVDFQGTRFDLKQFIKDQKEKFDDGHVMVDKVSKVRILVNRLIEDQMSQLEAFPPTRDEAKDIEKHVRGLLRAKMSLEDMLEEADDLDKSGTSSNAIEDLKRWLSYARRIN